MAGLPRALEADVNDKRAASAADKHPATRNLLLRVASALILAPLAVATAYAGDLVFVAFWAVAAFAVWWEWVRLVTPGDDRNALITGFVALGFAATLVATGRFEMALLITALGAFAVIVTAAQHVMWVAGGLIYAGCLLLAPVAVRGDARSGFLAMIFLFLVVWMTDIAGYFVGRTLGGPKLAPAISPKKTWSGAIGGMAGAVCAAIALALAIGSDALVQAGLLALLISIVAQAGDLFESKVKRMFNAKDSSGLIPGHGGVMDRVDGFLMASVALALLDYGRTWLGDWWQEFSVW